MNGTSGSLQQHGHEAVGGVAQAVGMYELSPSAAPGTAAGPRRSKRARGSNEQADSAAGGYAPEEHDASIYANGAEAGEGEEQGASAAGVEDAQQQAAPLRDTLAQAVAAQTQRKEQIDAMVRGAIARPARHAACWGWRCGTRMLGGAWPTTAAHALVHLCHN
jgi:hypothetical protein